MTLDLFLTLCEQGLALTCLTSTFFNLSSVATIGLHLIGTNLVMSDSSGFGIPLTSGGRVPLCTAHIMRKAGPPAKHKF